MLRIDASDYERLIRPLYANPKPRFWLAVGFLLIIIGFGIYMYIRQVIFGLGTTGMGRPNYWGIYMVNFIFFIGISHAGTLISAILRVMGAEWRRPITRVAETITTFALILGTLQIFIDMGRPDRIINVIIHGRLQSPILWDVTAVTVYFLSSVVYLYLPLIPDVAILRDNFPPGGRAWQRSLYTLLALNWHGKREQWHRLEKAISVMAVLIIPVAVSVHTIISWILATTVQPGWHSTIFGPYFVIGAIFSGIGALFLAMTGVRRSLHLDKYITLKQYRNLGLLFISMNAIWFYFTFSEHLLTATGQQQEEFIVLASKLWGKFALGFWVMIVLMFVSFVIQVVPKLLPGFAIRSPVFRPTFSLASTGAAAVLLFILTTSAPSKITASLSEPIRYIGFGIVIILFIIAGLGIFSRFKNRLVASTTIASLCVLAGMWQERWFIIIPTMSFPRLIREGTYIPTLTEWSITAASIALFVLMFLIFFKLFPAVSIWEVLEGRVIEEARDNVIIPAPKANERWLRNRQKTSLR